MTTAVGPSPDLTERQLREILYDHLVTRRAAPVDYDVHFPGAQLGLADYAERCRGETLGIGRIDPLTGLWRPLLPKGDHNG
jgi:adenosine tuberculosinyltransferase